MFLHLFIVKIGGIFHQKEPIIGEWKFRCAICSAFKGVKRTRPPHHHFMQLLFLKINIELWFFNEVSASDSFSQLLGIFQCLSSVIVVGIYQGLQYVHPLFFRKISTSINWTTIGQGEAIEWPTTFLRDQLNGSHVNLVNVRALFAIDFYIDEMCIHQCSDFLVFKTFVFHHMAPMASRITHTDEHQLILRFGLFKNVI